MTTAGILGAVGIYWVDAPCLSLLSVGVFMLAIFTSHTAGRQNGGRKADWVSAGLQSARS